jgi:hypothetical protein
MSARRGLAFKAMLSRKSAGDVSRPTAFLSAISRSFAI